MTEFAHLHLHTEFSLLDGMGRIDQYIRRAQALGMHHMAVTDHGVMYAAMEWYQAATKAGIHPIVGIEAYLAEGSIQARERKSYHLLMLAENETGYRNLLKLASKASLDGFYYRPRIDLELLQQYHEGIIATSACLGGPVANPILNGQAQRGYEYAGKLAEIFGRDRFFIELQDHGMEDQRRVNTELIPLAKKLGLPLVATNDVHYCVEEDAVAQDILVCVQTNTTVNDTKRLKSESTQLFLKSPAEMGRVFAEIPAALSNTIRIAEMCDLELGFKGYQLPKFDVPTGEPAPEYLRRLCEEGVRRKYDTVDDRIRERLDYELNVINSMGFTDYFLIVWDFVRYAKQQGILVGPGRGSAAGSLVTYALDVTGLDPLKYDLMFERFLNPSRISMPDIDIDFADDRRGEVIEYVVRKYGEDRVAQIATFGTLKAKASVRDVGRAMGWSYGDTDRVARLIPTDPKMTIERALAEVPELKQLRDADDKARELLLTAQKVEGLARHSSTHAAGVVISRDPLVEHVPLQRAGGKSEGEVTTQWTMSQLEGIGLLKMDFLGLRTLTVLGKAIDLVRAAGHDISLETIPLDDPAALAMLRRGETAGVFQLEGGMTTRMTIDVAPESFEDLIALMALIRPGPMEMAPDYIARKHGRVPIEYMHPALEPILQETYGIALYQEQIMQIANVMAGFSMAEADGLRKAMGKKLPEEMAKYRDRFMEGCAANKIGEKLASALFAMIDRFAGYGFVKSHSAAYAVIAAQTAYLKANFPVQFMAAVLSTEIGNTEKIVFNVAECRRAGITVLPPDVNRSAYEFSVEKLPDGREGVRFALGAVKGVGAGAVSAILKGRDEAPRKTFESLTAFCDLVDWKVVSKRVVEALTRAGALDAFGERAAVLAALDPAIAAAQHR
ncbi:MAG: DNA polymerase III subunit alpha [Chloroflexota bacterium]|nr:DNA polymerase III subunit alpha [Chloroflexota bacterium]